MVKRALKEKPKLLFVVLPDRAQHRYSAVKVACDREQGVMNQCVMFDKVKGDRVHPSYWRNLCLKARSSRTLPYTLCAAERHGAS